MKKLGELGISPLPWTANGHWVDISGGFFSTGDTGSGYEDARFIAAEPELYDAAERVIRYHDMSCIEEDCTYIEIIEKYQTALADLRKALAKAAGEEGAK